MSKIITLFVCGMAAIMVLLLITRWATHKLSRKENENGVLQLPLSIWIACIFGAGSLMMYKALVAAGTAVDIWGKLKPSGATRDIITSCCVMIGIAAAWLVLLMGITTAFVAAILLADPKKQDKMEVNSTGYFVIRGGFLLTSSFLLLPVLEELLHICLPVFNLTYYH